MYSFRTAFQSFTSAEQNIIERRLTCLSITNAVGRQVEQNIWCESRLSVAIAKEILGGILNSSDNPGVLKSDYIDHCRRHILKGQLIGGVRPGVLGRVVTFDAFCKMIYKLRRSRFTSFDGAKEWVRKMLRLSAKQTAYYARNVPLGEYLMWATFCESDPNQNPFKFLPGTADELMDIFGLNPFDRGKSVLLLVYAPPPGLNLRFPTVADAQWAHQFRPAQNGHSVHSGFTLPLNNKVQCQPELVHEPVTGDVIREAIKEVL